jgi:hypothetical protein
LPFWLRLAINIPDYKTPHHFSPSKTTMTTVLSVPKQPVIRLLQYRRDFPRAGGVSVVVLLGLASRGDGWALVLENFIEASMLIEAICLLSLFLLCACRRYAYSHASPAWLQRLACVLIPAAGIFLLALRSV